MFLKERTRGELVEVLFVEELLNPYMDEIMGRYHHGEEMQDPARFNKKDLVFPSGEVLPQCWVNSHYRDQELKRA